jgi:hypothetical protein
MAVCFYCCSYSPHWYIFNFLHKVLLMTGLLEEDTVTALFPHSTSAPGSGPHRWAEPGGRQAPLPGTYSASETACSQSQDTHTEVPVNLPSPQPRKTYTSSSQTWNRKRARHRQDYQVPPRGYLCISEQPPPPASGCWPIHTSSSGNGLKSQVWLLR